MSARKRTARVWVLSHVDLVGCTNHPHADAMIGHVAGSSAAARRRVKTIHIDATAWWELRSFAVGQGDPDRDSVDETRVRYFDHRGRPVQAPAYRRCRAAFDRERAAELADGLFPKREDLCPGCRRALRE